MGVTSDGGWVRAHFSLRRRFDAGEAEKFSSMMMIPDARGGGVNGSDETRRSLAFGDAPFVRGELKVLG